MDVAKNSDHIQIKMKMLNPIQEHPATFKAPNKDLKDMCILCIFKIKIESLNFEHGCIEHQWQYTNQDQDKMQICSQEPSASSKAPYVNPNQDAEP